MYGYFEVKIIMKRIWKWVLNLYYKKYKLCINRNENVLRYMKMDIYKSILFYYYSWVEELFFLKVVLFLYLLKEFRLGWVEGGFLIIGFVLYMFCLL